MRRKRYRLVPFGKNLPSVGLWIGGHGFSPYPSSPYKQRTVERGWVKIPIIHQRETTKGKITQKVTTKGKIVQRQTNKGKIHSRS